MFRLVPSEGYSNACDRDQSIMSYESSFSKTAVSGDIRNIIGRGFGPVRYLKFPWKRKFNSMHSARSRARAGNNVSIVDAGTESEVYRCGGVYAKSNFLAIEKKCSSSTSGNRKTLTSTTTGSMRLIERVPCASAQLLLVKLRFIGSSMVWTFLLPASHGLLNVRDD